MKALGSRIRNKKNLAFLLAVAMLLGLLLVMVIEPTGGIEPVSSSSDFTISNPYESVDWEEFGQYRAALHIHTTISDGLATVAETVLDHYNKGFDIIAITDHSNWAGGHPAFSGDWATGPDSLTESQRDAIHAGTFGRTAYSNFEFPGDFGPGFYRSPEQGGMIAIPFSNEQSRTEHILTFWADFTDASDATEESTLQTTDDLGGIAILAHPGRYTTGVDGNPASSDNPLRISRYIELFDRFESVLGFEIFNRNDHETRADRVLWDNVLMELMPYGRPIWGFANDDSHSMNQAGFNWNVLLLPELNPDYAKEAMQEGVFYMVARVNRGIGHADPEVNSTLPGGASMPNGGNADTVFMLHQNAPSIINIEVEEDTITITAVDYTEVTWVADGVIIHTGNYLDVVVHWDNINNNYVRAQIIGLHGVAMTQPFGILPEGEEFLERPETNNLVSIDESQPVYVRHGVSLTPEGLRLPATVQVVFERG